MFDHTKITNNYKYSPDGFVLRSGTFFNSVPQPDQMNSDEIVAELVNLAHLKDRRGLSREQVERCTEVFYALNSAIDAAVGKPDLWHTAIHYAAEKLSSVAPQLAILRPGSEQPACDAKLGNVCAALRRTQGRIAHERITSHISRATSELTRAVSLVDRLDGGDTTALLSQLATLSARIDSLKSALTPLPSAPSTSTSVVHAPEINTAPIAACSTSSWPTTTTSEPPLVQQFIHRYVARPLLCTEFDGPHLWNLFKLGPSISPPIPFLGDNSYWTTEGGLAKPKPTGFGGPSRNGLAILNSFGPGRPVPPTEASIAAKKKQKEEQEVKFKKARSDSLETLLTYELRSDVRAALEGFKLFIDSHDVPASDITPEPHSGSVGLPREPHPVKFITTEGLRSHLSEVIGEILLLEVAMPEVISIYKLGSSVAQPPMRLKEWKSDSVNSNFITPDDGSPQSLNMLEPAFEWTPYQSTLKLKELELPKAEYRFEMWGSRLRIGRRGGEAGPSEVMKITKILAKIDYLLPAYSGDVADKLNAIKQKLNIALEQMVATK